MFDGLIYQIDTVNHVLNVDVSDMESSIRKLRIEINDGRQFALCSSRR